MSDVIADGDVLELTMAVRVGHVLPGGDIILGNSNLRLNLDRDVKSWRHFDSDD